MRKQILPFSIFSVCILSIACNQSEKAKMPDRKFLDLTAMDSATKPGDNFYTYVNGKWERNTIIPSTEYGVGGFTDLYNRTQVQLHTLLDSISKRNHTPGSIEQKVSDFYASGMDSATIEKLGNNPVKPYLGKIEGIKNASDVMQYAIELQKENQNILYAINITPDDKSSMVNIAAFSQFGLGLPDRDYYFRKDSSTLKIVKAYQNYLVKLFMLTGDDSLKAHRRGAEVYELEKKMAESHKTNQELRDPQTNYHKLSVNDLNNKMPFFAWKSTLSAMGINLDSVNIQQPAYYTRLNELLKTVKPDIWKSYLQFHTLDVFATSLSNDFVMASFDYNHKALAGQQEIKPRWDRMVAMVDRFLGEALGQVYVNVYFNQDAKKRMLDLVNNLQIAFDARINKLDWMSDSTKTRAKEKLHLFIKKIGYPDTWKDYSKVVIDRDKFFENKVSCNKNEYHRVITKLGKPVDRTEWGLTPPTINAYYNPSFNEIVFPAGILQPPFFDPAADDAVNYGGIGMVIGHEMTHGFDDQGAQYDKDGNLKNWWTHEDSVKFVARTKAIVQQFNGFIAIDTMHVNGSLTTGENIADLGGLNIAYDAFKLTKQGQDTMRIDGLTPDERFFMSLATIWRSKYKDELVRQWLNIDPHSPDRFRVIGPLENFTPFYITFHVQPGDKMYRAETERIKIW